MVLETLTDQQRLHDTRLVTLKKRYYHPQNILPKIGCIVVFPWNC
jgi:hypothetical protein